MSEAAKAELVEHTPIPAGLIDVVPNAVGELHAPDGAHDAMRDRFHLGADPVIAWVGTMEPRKNLITLVDAFAALLERAPSARLVLIGPDGWNGAADAVRQRAVPLGDRVVLAGRCSDADRDALIASPAFPASWRIW